MGTFTVAQLQLMGKALVRGGPVVRDCGHEREYRCRHCDEVVMQAVLRAFEGREETPLQRAPAEYQIVEHLRRPPARNRHDCVKEPVELLSSRSATA